MPTYIDQMMRKVALTPTPLRIISLVPSQTELLYDLGLDDRVIGITKFCVHPPHWIKQKVIVGGTKKLNHKIIAAHNPDLIIGNKEENTKEDILQLEKQFPVWMSDIYTLQDALHMIIELSKITDTVLEGERIKQSIIDEFEQLRSLPIAPKRVAYFIWKDPMMVAASNTFIDHMLQTIGCINVFSKNEFPAFAAERYPQIKEQDLMEAHPHEIWLSSEPFPFKAKHESFFKALCPHAEVKIVDGEMFSWYGSRLMQAPAYFKNILA